MKTQMERVADRFAADLMMPHYLFKPAAQLKKRLTFNAVIELADMFSASISATAIRLIEADIFPALAICHGPHGRKWFARAPMVPRRWFPQQILDSESYAFDVQFGNRECTPSPTKIGADAWFDRRESERYELLEQTICTGADETISLLTITDERMLDE